MSLVKCSECQSQLANIACLHLHYKYCHLNVKKYVCQFLGCKREYGVWDSYRKHLLSVHNVSLHGKVESNDLENCEPTAEPIAFRDIDNDIPCNQDTTFDLKEFHTELRHSADALVAKLLSIPGLPRCFVDIIIQDVMSFLSGNFLHLLKNFVLSSVVNDGNSNCKIDIEKSFDLLCSPFGHIASEYLRLKYFQSCGDYIPPQQYVIAVRPERINTKHGIKHRMTEVTGQFIPVGQVLKKFMELPDAFDLSLSYVKSLKGPEEMLSSFLQSAIWQRKLSRFKENDIVFPVMIYYDDFEPNNPLGPHCEKLGAVYLFLPFLPPECQGKLENIFLALLFNASDRSTYGNSATFRPLLQELTKLETDGITIQTQDGPQSIYFVAGLLLGDNLGLNGMAGFVESFTANHVCRVCKVSKDILGSLCEEDPSLLRTRENYLADVDLHDVSATGIKEQCVFDEVPSFEAPSDISVDPFHDTEEGVNHYVMVPILEHFHDLNPMFIETLNNRMYVINLGVDNDNRPPSIDIEKVKKSKKLKMTGAEMLTFVRIFGVLSFDMIPEQDPYYDLYLLLNDIVSITHAKRLPRDAAVVLSVKVKELNSLYMQLTKLTLKPKHHFLLHYPGLLILIGPTGCISTIRLEGKHKFLKLITNVCVSRKNLPKTVAIKHQLNVCFRFICNESIKPPLVLGPGQVIDLKELENFHLFKRSMPTEILDESAVFCVKWVDFKGTLYKIKDTLVTDFSAESRCPEFSEIEYIIIFNGVPYFVCSQLFTLGFFSEVRGYEVERNDQSTQKWHCISHMQLIDPYPITLLCTSKSELIAIVKSFL